MNGERRQDAGNIHGQEPEKVDRHVCVKSQHIRRLVLYPQKGTLEVRLQKKPDYAVRDLVGARPVLTGRD